MLADFLITPFADFAFMRRALVAVIAVSLVAGPLGVFLQLRRMSLMGDALAHAILPGVAIGFFLFGLDLWAMSVGGLVACLAVALLSGASTITSTRGPAGSVRLFGQDIAAASPRRRRHLGLHFVPEERLGRGAVPSLSLADNTLLTRTEAVKAGGWLAKGEARRLAERVIALVGAGIQRVGLAVKSGASAEASR